MEIITRGEPSLGEVLDSLSNQSFNDFEVVCVNSSRDKEVSRLIKSYSFKEISTTPDTKALKARYIAHKNVRGERRLILDSTRPLEKKGIEILVEKYEQYPAVCIREGSLGVGFWVAQAERLRSVSEKRYKYVKDNRVAYFLPRFYDAKILGAAFEFLRNNIPSELFNLISYGEHYLIYEQVPIENLYVPLTEEVLLRHHEDDSLDAIFRKYHWYGKSQRVLNSLKFQTGVTRFSTHFRPFFLQDMFARAMTMPLIFTRTIAFILGYLQG